MVVRQNWPLRGDPEGGFGFQGPSVCACGFSDVMGSGGRRGAAKKRMHSRKLSAPQSIRKLRVDYWEIES